MTVSEMIGQHVQKLSYADQVEVLDFVEFLEQKYRVNSAVRERAEWSSLSMDQAMRGMENEPSSYSSDDIIKD